MTVRKVLHVAGWIAAVLATLRAVGIFSAQPLGYDTALYLAWARQLLSGGGLYSATAPYAGPEMYYPYTPLTPLPFVPLAVLQVDLANGIWILAQVGVAATIGYRLIRPLSAELWPWAIAGFALFGPLIAEIILGNLNLLTLGLCIAAWELRARPIWSGGALALAVGLKLMPLALPLFFLAAGVSRPVVWTAGIGGLALLISLATQRADWAAYLSLLPDIPHAVGTKTAIAPTGALIEAIRLVTTVLLTIVAGRLARGPAAATLSFALALAVVPLAAPLIVYNYLIFALPLLAALLHGRPSWPWAAAGVGFLAMNTPTPPGGPMIAFAGLVLVFAAGLATAVRAPGLLAARPFPWAGR